MEANHYYLITDAIGSLSDHQGYKAGTVVWITDKHNENHFTVTDGVSSWYVHDGELLEVSTVTYNGIKYPIRTVIIEGAMYNISTDELSDKLAAANYEGEAQQVDDMIYFYAPAEQIHTPVNDLKRYVTSETK